MHVAHFTHELAEPNPPRNIAHPTVATTVDLIEHCVHEKNTEKETDAEKCMCTYVLTVLLYILM